MTALLAGLVVLVLVVQILRWAAYADVKKIRKSINWGVLSLIALVIVGLALTGRMGAALAGLFAMMAWIGRILSMLSLGRQFRGMFSSFRFGRGAGSAGTQTSDVDSAYLRMTLDHGTGAMAGEVKRGRFEGRRLKDLDQAALFMLLQDVQGDPDSVGLLEAYLDRTHPNWREDSGTMGGPAPPSQGAMTAEEAYRVLGLKPDASDADVKAAYRRLMAQLHPDHGGSDYLAAKVNQAKDLLLKRRTSAET